MKFATAAAALFSLGFVESNEVIRKLQTAAPGTLAAKYAISSMSLSQVGKVLTVDIAHGAGDGYGNILDVWMNPAAPTTGVTTNACPYHDGSAAGRAFTVKNDNEDPQIDGIQSGIKTKTYSEPGLSTAGTTSWSFEFAEGIEDVAAAYAAGSPPKVYFCVVFTVTSVVDGAVRYQNFREFAIAATLNLNGNIDNTQAFELSPVDAIEDIDNTVQYKVTGGLCEDVTGVTGTDLVQGQAVPYCVCADDYPITSVSSFETLAIAQEAWTVNSVIGGALQTQVAESLGCGVLASGKQCCRVDTILNSNFYLNAGNVLATGVVSLIVGDGTRRLTVGLSEANRGLQTTEEVEREFETEFTVTASGAVSQGMVSAFVSLAALAFIM